MKKKLTKGFTLIELMIVVAIIGILAAVAIPAFLEYMRSGKSSEADLALNRAVKSAKTWRVRTGGFPNSAAGQADDPVTPGLGGGGPGQGSCAMGNKKYTAGQFAAPAGGIFAAIEFTVEDDFRFDYESSATSADAVQFQATADLDCDTQGVSTARADLLIDGAGNPTATFSKSGSD